MSSHVERGRWGEDLAAAYLALTGYRILERNFRYSRLEIDILARRGNVLAVVEVKFRRRNRLGGARGAVGPSKQRDLETAVVGYLRTRGRDLPGMAVRFDVITLELEPDDAGLVVKHLRNAFPATGRYRM